MQGSCSAAALFSILHGSVPPLLGELLEPGSRTLHSGGLILHLQRFSQPCLSACGKGNQTFCHGWWPRLWLWLLLTGYLESGTSSLEEEQAAQLEHSLMQ